MSIKVKFFARMREELGRAEDEMPYRAGLKVSDVWQEMSAGRAMPDALLVAINMEHRRGDPALSDGDEVAFFPPVTGG